MIARDIARLLAARYLQDLLGMPWELLDWALLSLAGLAQWGVVGPLAIGGLSRLRAKIALRR